MKDLSVAVELTLACNFNLSRNLSEAIAYKRNIIEFCMLKLLGKIEAITMGRFFQIKTCDKIKNKPLQTNKQTKNKQTENKQANK